MRREKKLLVCFCVALALAAMHYESRYDMSVAVVERLPQSVFVAVRDTLEERNEPFTLEDIAREYLDNRDFYDALN